MIVEQWTTGFFLGMNRGRCVPVSVMAPPPASMLGTMVAEAKGLSVWILASSAWSVASNGTAVPLLNCPLVVALDDESRAVLMVFWVRMQSATISKPLLVPQISITNFLYDRGVAGEAKAE